ncbi:MAG: GGDEF domain-containing protein [Butyrivibrio sp.]|nr:GGDEF domain-containing protein [Butyrivibrio sp.]
MKTIDAIREIYELYKDYKTMNKEELADFYASKCDYYQKYVELSLVTGSFLFIFFILNDYAFNRSFTPTLAPRLSILVFFIIYAIGSNIVKSRGGIVLFDYFLAHGIVISALLVMYHLGDNGHAAESFIIMNLMWMVVGFSAKPHEVAISSLLFIGEVLIGRYFFYYDSLIFVLVVEVCGAIFVTCTHFMLVLFFLSHYRMKQKLELAMITDPLTQVYNRHLLEKIVSQNAIKDTEAPAAIAMLDIDNFRKINEENGHYTGDLTLLYMGQKLAKETHEDDYVIRYGGQEFVIILKNCDVNNACARMEQFRRDIESAVDTPVPFTISVGVSRYNGDYSKTIQNVANALEKARNKGCNNVVVV